MVWYVIHVEREPIDHLIIYRAACTHLLRRPQRKPRRRPALHPDDALVLLLRPAASAAPGLLPRIGGDTGLAFLGEAGCTGEEELEGLC